MKKRIFALLIMLIFVFSLSACSEKTIDNSDDFVEEDSEFIEDDGVYGEQAELTLFANGGIIWLGAEEPYDVDLSATAIDNGTTFAEAIGEEIHSVEKENAEFGGWTVYAVTTGEWIEKEATELADGQLCVACGDYGYYLMKEYELVSEAATTDELLAMKCDGRNFYALANWK